MPLYEYHCEPCGHRFEQIRRFSDPPLSVCPKCGGAVRKLHSSPAIQFKGTGWYVTDYARKGVTGDGASEPGKSGDGADAKPDAKSDKPNAKTGDSTSASDSPQATSKKSTSSSSSSNS